MVRNVFSVGDRVTARIPKADEARPEKWLRRLVEAKQVGTVQSREMTYGVFRYRVQFSNRKKYLLYGDELELVSSTDVNSLQTEIQRLTNLLAAAVERAERAESLLLSGLYGRAISDGTWLARRVGGHLVIESLHSILPVPLQGVVG